MTTSLNCWRLEFLILTTSSLSRRTTLVCLFVSSATTPGVVTKPTMTQEAAKHEYPAKRDTTDPSSRSLYDVCVDLRDRVDAFLTEEDPGTEVLRGVQRQLRISMGVVEEALAKYQFVAQVLYTMVCTLLTDSIGLSRFPYRIMVGRTVRIPFNARGDRLDCRLSSFMAWA